MVSTRKRASLTRGRRKLKFLTGPETGAMIGVSFALTVGIVHETVLLGIEKMIVRHGSATERNHGGGGYEQCTDFHCETPSTCEKPYFALAWATFGRATYTPNTRPPFVIRKVNLCDNSRARQSPSSAA
jgi:hypothetical protein